MGIIRKYFYVFCYALMTEELLRFSWAHHDWLAALLSMGTTSMAYMAITVPVCYIPFQWRKLS